MMPEVIHCSARSTVNVLFVLKICKTRIQTANPTIAYSTSFRRENSSFKVSLTNMLGTGWPKSAARARSILIWSQDFIIHILELGANAHDSTFLGTSDEQVKIVEYNLCGMIHCVMQTTFSCNAVRVVSGAIYKQILDCWILHVDFYVSEKKFEICFPNKLLKLWTKLRAQLSM